MNDINGPGIPTVTRRQLLAMLGVGGAVAATGGIGAYSLRGGAATAATPKGSTATTKRAAARSAPVAGPRALVVVELRGGNDGFATLVPVGDARFRRLRDRIWVDEKELVRLDDRYAVPKGLAPIKDRLAFVEGVGVAKPDLSHFAMLQRWWQADPDGTGARRTGFLGRCCDLVAGDQAIAGVSVGGGSSMVMVAERAATVALPQLDLVREIAKPEPEEERLRSSLGRFRPGSANDGGDGSLGLGDEPDHLLSVARASVGSGLDLLGSFARLGERPADYPDGELSTSLAMVRQLISMDAGMRVFHVPWGSFDTHSGQVGSHNDQMAQLGLALGAFLADLDAHGLADRVVVATISEFGRRAEANGSGTDHGTASTMLLAGAVTPGRHGEAPNFSRLDDAGNVRATTSMADYYATLAQWLGASVEDAVVKGATPITGVMRNAAAPRASASA